MVRLYKDNRDCVEVGETVGSTWPEIQKFAVRMQGRMSETGWMHGEASKLFTELDLDYVTELMLGLQSAEHPDRIWQRAADVANAALRVADSYAARYEEGD